MEGYKVMEDQVQSLEAEVKARTEECEALRIQLQRVEVEKAQLKEEIQSLKTLLEAGMVREVAMSAERKPQMLQAIHPLEDRLVALDAQTDEHLAKAKCQEHFQELNVLKEPLMETEKQLKTVWLEVLKFQKHQKLPRNLGPGIQEMR
ncbi:PREDICTED: ribosome-binding protein 1-like [Crocodylus porosus]|uniref:ribosome-binding protein 1-like n=1 Tax=Crocodylus porosus TaxID=8502 RepID=UPI00094014D3|nr:PREDICTED: ribosome-binding protein 1-like [Crocodylus porosus]